MRSEGAPLKRALQTWAELWRTIVAARTDAKALDAHRLAAFAQTHVDGKRHFGFGI